MVEDLTGARRESGEDRRPALGGDSVETTDLVVGAPRTETRCPSFPKMVSQGCSEQSSTRCPPISSITASFNSVALARTVLAVGR